VAVSTATSGVTIEIEQTTNRVVTDSTDGKGINEVSLVIGAATVSILFATG
jgi:hypothetical protein